VVSRERDEAEGGRGGGAGARGGSATALVEGVPAPGRPERLQEGGHAPIVIAGGAGCKELARPGASTGPAP